MKRIVVLLFVLSFISACGAALNSRVDEIMALDSDPEAGHQFYRSHCQNCHGVGGPPKLGQREDLRVLIRGRGSMPAYDSESDQDLADLSTYLETM